MKKISSRLADIRDRLADHDSHETTIGDIVDKSGPAGLELTLLALTFFSAIPGPSALVFGLLIFLVGAQAVIGAERLRLPEFVRRRRLRNDLVVAGLTRAVSTLQRIEDWMGPHRLWPLTPRLTRSALAVPLLAMSAALTLPVPFPFANLGPAISLIAIAVALILRDGLAVLFSWLLSFAALGWLAAILWQSVKVIEWITRLF